VREVDGKEVMLASWERAVAEEWLGCAFGVFNGLPRE
jgi:hypothetical protein